ncbi:MAG: hypothetical protein IKM77_02025 [Prevotella sp.]|nr:hypothetical protein [Prevotella sp.]
MNVLFGDYRFFREDSWSYIVDVLRIKKVFLFVKSSTFRVPYYGDAKACLNINTEDFPTKIVYEIVNAIKKPIYTPDGDFLGYDDLDLYSSSKWNMPEENILNTNDPNILVLGTIRQRVDGKTKVSYFENYSTSSNRDIACDIASHTLDILKSQLQTDKYKNRICFWLMDVINEADYVTTGTRWAKMPRLDHFIKWKLHEKYPKVFQLVINWDTNKYEITNLYSNAFFVEREKLEKKNNTRRINLEDEASYVESLYNGVSWEDEVKEMNEQFWNECGDAINEI